MKSSTCQAFFIFKQGIFCKNSIQPFRAHKKHRCQNYCRALFEQCFLGAECHNMQFENSSYFFLPHYSFCKTRKTMQQKKPKRFALALSLFSFNPKSDKFTIDVIFFCKALNCSKNKLVCQSVFHDFCLIFFCKVRELFAC